MDGAEHELAKEVDRVAGFEERWLHDRYDLLLALLVVLMVLFAFDDGGARWYKVVEAFLVAIVVIVGIAASGGLRRRGLGIVTIAVVVLACAAVLEPSIGTRQPRGHFLILTLLLAVLPLMVLRRILKHPKVDLRTVFGALCVYLILGFAFTFALLFIASVTGYDQGIREAANPDHAVVQRVYYEYYSFITLTTVGFGDYLPKGSPARMLTIAEAVMGQVLLVTLVARLVATLGQERTTADST